MRKEFSSVGGRMCLGVIITCVLQILCQNLVLALKPEWAENTTIMLAVGLVPMYVLGYPIMFALMKKGERTTIEKHSMSVGQWFVALVICYGIMIAGNLVGIGITSVIGILKGSPVQNVLMNVLSGGSLWLIALFTVVAAPIVEELLFRKVICDKVVKYGQGTAVVVSGLMFGLFHLNLNQFVYAFLMGMFLAFLYVKTGEIKYTIFIHMTVNFFGSVVSMVLMSKLDMENVISVLIFGAYALFIYAAAITGVVLFFVMKPKMKLEAGEIVIEKGQRFKTVILNVGMMAFCLVCIAYMIYQLML